MVHLTLQVTSYASNLELQVLAYLGTDFFKVQPQEMRFTVFNKPCKQAKHMYTYMVIMLHAFCTHTHHQTSYNNMGRTAFPDTYI